MRLRDCHTHSLCSFDSQAPLDRMAQAAREGGLEGLCLTDHCDFIDPRGRADFSFSWEPIEAQLDRVRPLFPGLTLGKGLELGEAWEDPALAGTIYRRPGVDLVLGSAHNMPLREGGWDYYELRYSDEGACFAALDVYFASLEVLAALDCFDVLAHVIYPLRYMNHRDGNRVTLDRYRGPLTRVFRDLLDAGRSLELNTCRGQTVEEWRDTLTLYRDLGGERVTLGSDAHEPRHVGAGLAAGAGLLAELGFPGVTVYENHRPILWSFHQS